MRMKLVLNSRADEANVEVGMFCQIMAVNRREGYLMVETAPVQHIPPWCAHATELTACTMCNDEQRLSK
jgi:hypothetical protein